MNEDLVRELLERVQAARTEQIYEDNPDWERIESLLTQLGYPVDNGPY